MNFHILLKQNTPFRVLVTYALQLLFIKLTQIASTTIQPRLSDFRYYQQLLAFD